MERERKEADPEKPSELLNKLRLSPSDDYQMAEKMLEATEIILNYGLDSFHYGAEDYNLMDEWRIRVQTCLDATMEDNITARRLFERFEEAWKTKLSTTKNVTRNMNKAKLRF